MEEMLESISYVKGGNVFIGAIISDLLVKSDLNVKSVRITPVYCGIECRTKKQREIVIMAIEQ